MKCVTVLFSVFSWLVASLLYTAAGSLYAVTIRHVFVFLKLFSFLMIPTHTHTRMVFMLLCHSGGKQHLMWGALNAHVIIIYLLYSPCCCILLPSHSLYHRARHDIFEHVISVAYYLKVLPCVKFSGRFIIWLAGVVI
jgi:hypothetical protein